MYSGAWLAPATSTRLSTLTGGIAAPEPSKTVTRVSRLLAISAPSRTFETKGSPARPPPHLRHPTVMTLQGRRLVVVARRVRPTPEGLEQILAPYLHLVTLDYLGAWWASAAHRDHTGVEALVGQESRQVTRDRRLPHPLARPDHGQRRLGRDGAKLRRRQLEVAAEIARPGVEGERGYLHPLLVADHRLVREVDYNVDGVCGEGLLYCRDGVLVFDQGDAVVGAFLDLLGASEEGSGHAFCSERSLHALHRIDDHGRIVLAVDQEQRPHEALAHRSPLATVPWSAIALDLLVVQVLVGCGVEVHDQLAVLERVLAEYLHPPVFDLYDVVAGARVTPEAGGRGRACVDDEHVLEPPGVRHVLVAGEYEVDLRIRE